VCLGQDLAQVLGEGKPLALTRIEGGIAFQTAGAALALFDDRVMIIYWTRAEEDLRKVGECVGRSLGAAFLVEDARKMRARGTPDHTGAPSGSPKPATTMILTDLDEPLSPLSPDDTHIAPSGRDDEDAGPSV